MARSDQEAKVVPVAFDQKGLDTVVTMTQLNLERIYDKLHEHPVGTDVPASSDGTVGDVRLVDVSGTPYIYAKLSAGWARVALAYI